MSKCTLAKLLREEIYSLTLLAEQLEDESKLCFPCEYNCAKCFSEAIGKLKRLKKMSRAVCNSDIRSELFFQKA